jgi:hypothetical protein
VLAITSEWAACAEIACRGHKRGGQIVDDRFALMRDPRRCRSSRHPRWYRAAIQTDLEWWTMIRRASGAKFRHEPIQKAGHREPEQGNK